MKLFNTLSMTKESFSPSNNDVKMYVCGITPYASAHIGHAMVSIVFDVLRRYLEYKKFTVTHIQNFTDVDDKMIQAASKSGDTVIEIAEKNIASYMKEMDQLNILRATTYPRATLEIPSIISLIQGLINKNYAYNVDGNVFFRVKKSTEYGKLSHRRIEDLLAGARIEIDERKEYPGDFALWKKTIVDTDPSWDSPWGNGRPGWHIECSAMATTYLGEMIDIHGGGQDLIFPHHENEIAQSESFSNKKPYSKFWLHNGMLRLGQEKMSKSVGNIISISEALKKFSPDAIRLFFLTSHYRDPITYSEDNILSQERALERLINASLLEPRGSTEVRFNTDSYIQQFNTSMDDDLNTPRALSVLFNIAREINRNQSISNTLEPLQSTLKILASVLGLSLTKRENIQADNSNEGFIELLIEIRSDMRKSKQFDAADKIRDGLEKLNVLIEDHNDGTDWKFSN
ncbi:MAG: cysteine--tRNA ligase [SAR202 cluster bacterium]|nr:cysteine--tRNA ligase [SAR202 cluster bacterium]